MAKYRNKSDQPFVDGDVTLAPGEEITTNDQARKDMFTGLYRWQFEEVSDKDTEITADDATSEAAYKERGAADLRELRDGAFVQVDAEGNQAELVDGNTDVAPPVVAETEDEPKAKSKK